MSGRSPDQLAREVWLGAREGLTREGQAALAELQAQAEAGQRYAEALREIERLYHGQGARANEIARTALAAAVPAPAGQECDGSRECRAAVHLHGCYAERPSA